MNRFLLIITLLFSLVWAVASAGTSPEEDPAFTFSVANESYRNGDFAKAAEEYQRLIDSGQVSAELYFNMGNACHKLNRKAEAILYYEKALRLRPGDEDTQYNLEWVSSQIKNRTELIPELFIVRWMRWFRDLMSEKSWGVLVVGSLIFLCFSLWSYLFAMNRFLKRASLYLALLFTLSLSASAVAGSSRRAWIENATEAVVKAEKLTVFSAPDQNSTQLFLIYEGSRVKILDKVGDWREIRLRDGNKGWVKMSDILII